MVGSCKNHTESRYNPANSTSVNDYSLLSGIDSDILRKNGSKRNTITIEQTAGTVYEYMYSSNSLVEITKNKTSCGESLGFNSAGKLVKGVDNKSLSISNGINMIPEFCRTYYQKTHHKVIIVSASLGGKTIDKFLPSNDPKNTEPNLRIYDATKEKYTAAIKYLKNNGYNIGTQAYVVFQGETDIVNNTSNYYDLYMKVHKNLKSFGIQKGALVEVSRAAGTVNMQRINLIHNAQLDIINKNSDIVLGSSFSYDRYVSTESDYKNCNTKITKAANGSKLSYTEALKRARMSEDYMEKAEDNNAIHFTSAALSQIGRQTATNLGAVIDYTAPTISVKYSTTAKTNQNVVVTLGANEQIKPVSGWTISSDKKTLTKTYTANKTETVTVYDLAGNSRKVNVNVSNIDKTAPTINVKYSTTVETNQNVVVTLEANEQIKQVSGWTLSSDKKSLTKTYSENETEQVTVYDLVGNRTDVTIRIDNIIKEIEPEDDYDFGYEINNENEVIGIKPKTPIEDFKRIFINNNDVEIEMDETNNTKYAQTGIKINIRTKKGLLEDDNENIITYTLVVTGDVTGDGKADTKDHILIKAHRMEIQGATLEDEYFKAGDLNKDEIIDYKDSNILLLHRSEVIGYNLDY